jgi:hypothetical protein
MRRIVLLLVALVVTTLALACGEEGEEATTPTASPEAMVTATPQVTPSPEATPTAEPIATEEPTTAPPVSGQASPEEAIVQWARQECVDPFCGWEYAGDCSSTAAEELRRFCSSLFESGNSQRVYSVGPTQSQFAKWLLLEQQADGTWLVVDSAVVEETLEPPQPPWTVAGGH